MSKSIKLIKPSVILKDKINQEGKETAAHFGLLTSKEALWTYFPNKKVFENRLAFDPFCGKDFLPNAVNEFLDKRGQKNHINMHLQVLKASYVRDNKLIFKPSQELSQKIATKCKVSSEDILIDILLLNKSNSFMSETAFLFNKLAEDQFNNDKEFIDWFHTIQSYDEMNEDLWGRGPLPEFENLDFLEDMYEEGCKEMFQQEIAENNYFKLKPNDPIHSLTHFNSVELDSEHLLKEVVEMPRSNFTGIASTPAEGYYMNKEMYGKEKISRGDFLVDQGDNIMSLPDKVSKNLSTFIQLVSKYFPEKSPMLTPFNKLNGHFSRSGRFKDPKFDIFKHWEIRGHKELDIVSADIYPNYTSYIPINFSSKLNGFLGSKTFKNHSLLKLMEKVANKQILCEYKKTLLIRNLRIRLSQTKKISV